jgi:N-acetylneuraminate synthase
LGKKPNSLHCEGVIVRSIRIAEHEIGSGKPSFIIGEVAQAHDGSVNMAHAYIDAIASAGADAVKFQTHIAEAEGTAAETFRKSSPWIEESKAQFWQRTGFDAQEWKGLAAHAKERGLVFLSSPFSVEAVDLLERLDIAAWKVASGEANNLQMLERMAKTRKPILLSAGMSPWDEQDRTVEFVKKLGAPLALFQCTTSYPCPPEELGLNLIAELRERYEVPVGLSDHSGKIFAGLAATSLGANMLEVHVTLSREIYGTSVDASLTTAELRELVDGVRFIEAALASPVDKDNMAKAKANLRPVFFRSVVATQDLSIGTVLGNEHLTTKKPGTGIPADRLHEMLGRKLARPLKKDQLLAEEDLA